MSGETGNIGNPKFQIRLRPDGIVHVVLSAGVVLELEDAVAMTDAIAEFFGGRQYPLLVDTKNARARDRPARLELARRDLASATAVIADSPFSRITGNLFVSVSQSMVPTRLFDDEASAVAWLEQFTAGPSSEPDV
jgi:hypothetical protein